MASIVLIAIARLPLKREALERRQLMRVRHPADSLGDLNVGPRRDPIRFVGGGTLDIDAVRQHLLVLVEEAGAAVGAEVPPAVFRGRVDPGRALRQSGQTAAASWGEPTDYRRPDCYPDVYLL